MRRSTSASQACGSTLLSVAVAIRVYIAAVRSPHRPCHPDYCLLVTYGQIAPCEHSEQLAVPPQIEPIISLEPAGLNDNNFRHVQSSFQKVRKLVAFLKAPNVMPSPTYDPLVANLNLLDAAGA